MIYELRTYEPHPGKMPALQQRFADHTLGIFERLGFKVIGFWTPTIGNWTNRLIYTLAFESMEQRDQAFTAFAADPERRRVFEESERDGPVIARLTNEIWRPTSFSPLQ